MATKRTSSWRQRPPLADDVRCVALLWYARYPQRYTGDVRCSRAATYRVVSTESVVCDLHAAVLRIGRSIDTVTGPVSGRVLESLPPLAPKAPVAPVEKPWESGRANATREAFPEGLPSRPEGFEDRRWHVVNRRLEGASLAEIASEMDISRERAHQLEESALRALAIRQDADEPTTSAEAHER